MPTPHSPICYSSPSESSGRSDQQRAASGRLRGRCLRSAFTSALPTPTSSGDLQRQTRRQISYRWPMPGPPSRWSSRLTARMPWWSWMAHARPIPMATRCNTTGLNAQRSTRKSLSQRRRGRVQSCRSARTRSFLVVNDGILSATNAVTVEVITTAQAVERLIAEVTARWPRARPLVATLCAALSSIERGNLVSAINQLQAFQNKVRAQVAPSDPVPWRLLSSSRRRTSWMCWAAATLILGAGRTAGLAAVAHQPNGRAQLNSWPNRADVHAGSVHEPGGLGDDRRGGGPRRRHIRVRGPERRQVPQPLLPGCVAVGAVWGGVSTQRGTRGGAATKESHKLNGLNELHEQGEQIEDLRRLRRFACIVSKDTGARGSRLTNWRAQGPSGNWPPIMVAPTRVACVFAPGRLRLSNPIPPCCISQSTTPALSPKDLPSPTFAASRLRCSTPSPPFVSAPLETP